MRTVFLTLSLVVGLSMVPAVDAGTEVALGPAFGSVVLAAPAVEAAQMPQINVDINEGGSRTWNPMWIAIGVIGLLLILVLFRMSNRSGSR